jgi:hypothetical protein
MTAVAPPPAAKPPKLDANPYPWYSPRFWHGMRPGAWWKLCADHGFRIHPIRWPMAFLIGLITPFNTVMGAAQRVWYGRQIDRAELKEPPVFIIGHWRSGTTYLHELMHLDERFVSPTTYQCFAPHHCLLTEGLMTSLGGWLMPKQRRWTTWPPAGPPAGRRVALLTLAPTPYLRMAFPRTRRTRVSTCRAARKDLTVRAGDRAFREAATLGATAAALKSPPHTGGSRCWPGCFPGQVHSHRPPSVSLFPSTMRLWQSLDEVQGCNARGGNGRICVRLPDADVSRLRGSRQRLPAADLRRVRGPGADPVNEVGRSGDSCLAILTQRDKMAEFVASRRTISQQAPPGESLKDKIRERGRGI